MLKVESRSPLTFVDPRLGTALRGIAGSLIKHAERGEITAAIWNAVKKARAAQMGSSSYATEVTGKFKTMQEATEAWQGHYKRREQCELRTRRIAETLRGTSQEVEELRTEMDILRGGGLAATRLAVIDEADDVWYGAQCYMVAYQEQCQRAITTWSGQAKQATTIGQWR